MMPVWKTASGSEMEQAEALAKGQKPNMGLTDNLPGLNKLASFFENRAGFDRNKLGK